MATDRITRRHIDLTEDQARILSLECQLREQKAIYAELLKRYLTLKHKIGGADDASGTTEQIQ